MKWAGGGGGGGRTTDGMGLKDIFPLDPTISRDSSAKGVGGESNDMGVGGRGNLGGGGVAILGTCAFVHSNWACINCYGCLHRPSS